MKEGGAQNNAKIIIDKDKITKIYRKKYYKDFVNELSFYLLQKQKKLKFIPKLLSYDIQKRTLVIENAGISIRELCRKRECNKEEFLPEIKKMYDKLVSLGFYHNDMRWRNIIYNESKDQFFLIDFEHTSPEYTDLGIEGIVEKLKTIKKKTKKKSRKKK